MASTGRVPEVLAALPELALRVYAPVGEHRDLLAYAPVARKRRQLVVRAPTDQRRTDRRVAASPLRNAWAGSLPAEDL
jgi:hypothetical protein